MKKLLLLISISCATAACSDIGAFNSLKQLESFVQKTEQNSNSDVCFEGIPLLVNIVNNTSYQANVLQIMDLLDKIPQIKQCEGYGTIEETLNMATGYKNVQWGSSLDTVRKTFGKMRLISWYATKDPFSDYFGKFEDIFTAFPDNPFLLDEERRRDDEYKGLVSAKQTVRIYVNGNKYFLFYNGRFFAYSEELPYPSSENRDIYLQNLRQKYGKKDTYEERGFALFRTRLHTWVFGNTYIVLRNEYYITYIDKNVLDELNKSYENTQAKLKVEEEIRREQHKRQTQTVANSL